MIGKPTDPAGYCRAGSHSRGGTGRHFCAALRMVAAATHVGLQRVAARLQGSDAPDSGHQHAGHLYPLAGPHLGGSHHLHAAMLGFRV